MTVHLGVAFLALCFVAASCLQPGNIAYVERKIFGTFPELLATDGAVYIRVVGSLRGPFTCVHTHDAVAVNRLLGNKDVIYKTLGKEGVQNMVRRCTELYSHTHNDKRSADLHFPHEPFPPEQTGQPAGSKGSLLIYPGTKWCGEGNAASSYADLGVHAATDSCCRTHDHCPYFMGAFETKYHHRNLYPWTLSICDCDRALYHCLKGVNTTTSNGVGISFFGLLSVDCFTFKTGEYCAKYHWSHLWCEQKKTGPEASVQKLGLRW